MKSRLELRPGFFTDPKWLRTVNCSPGGLYGYAQFRKPLGKDCVFVNLTFTAEQFGVTAEAIRLWLVQLEGWGLTWRHQARAMTAHGVCLHFNKAGDHRGNLWVPVEPTHLDRYRIRSQEKLGPERVRSQEIRVASSQTTLGPAPRNARGGKPLRASPQLEATAEHLPQRATASRTPVGARGGADQSEAEMRHLIENAPEGIRETLRGNATRAEDAARLAKEGSDR